MGQDLEEAFQYEVLKMLKKEGKKKCGHYRKHALLAAFRFLCLLGPNDLAR
jgi:hypothetical protein